MFQRLYLNGGIEIFRGEGSASDEVEWIDCAEIKEISWANLQETAITLSGPMPVAKGLIQLKDGDRLEILHRDHGDHAEYDPELIIIRIGNCKVIRKWFKDISRSDFENVLILQVTLEGQMSFWF